MDIEFTEEQKILQDSIERMLRANYDFDKRRDIVKIVPALCLGPGQCPELAAVDDAR